MRVKICGLTRPEHVLASAEADALGFVVESPRSPRDLPLERAREMMRLARPFQTLVAVTAAHDPETHARIVRTLHPHALQAPHREGADHGGLRREFPSLRLFLACRPENAETAAPHADALVLDAAAAHDGYGGKGILTDWTHAAKVTESLPVPVILAGGLTPENVAEAARVVRPYAVDVSSGVETNGTKDTEKIAAFIRAARSV